ncbi:MAG: hypothetical protein IJ104_03140 [Methanobrevibacter sp.]|nr:hypothetical protein [Methanobrevibacter sp.]
MIRLKVKGPQKYWKLKTWVRELLWKYEECVICGSRKNLEPHHIIRCNTDNPIFFSPDNGVVLCHKCHNSYHRMFDEVNPHTFVKFSQKYSKR